MRRAFKEGLRAGWDDMISSAVLAREIVAALFDCIMDMVSGKPLPHLDLPEEKTAPEGAEGSGGRDKAA